MQRVTNAANSENHQQAMDAIACLLPVAIGIYSAINSSINSNNPVKIGLAVGSIFLGACSFFTCCILTCGFAYLSASESREERQENDIIPLTFLYGVLSVAPCLIALGMVGFSFFLPNLTDASSASLSPTLPGMNGP